jgi:hypothetical protein
MTYEEIHAELKRHGTEIGHYQLSTQVTSAPAALQGHISDGFCSGASLDWVRCVLNGGSAATGPEVLPQPACSEERRPHPLSKHKAISLLLSC